MPKRTAPTAADKPLLRIIPLGGVGEIGKNMYVFEYGEEIVVIDCGLMGNKIREHKLNKNPLLAFEPGQTVRIGAFEATPFRIGHSIPDAMGIALRTPVGVVVHTGDFKFDHTPVDGKLSDFHALAKLGEEGVLCLLSDSTRAENPGYTPSERTVGEAF